MWMPGFLWLLGIPGTCFSGYPVLARHPETLAIFIPLVAGFPGTCYAHATLGPGWLVGLVSHEPGRLWPIVTLVTWSWRDPGSWETQPPEAPWCSGVLGTWGTRYQRDMGTLLSWFLGTWPPEGSWFLAILSPWLPGAWVSGFPGTLVSSKPRHLAFQAPGNPVVPGSLGSWNPGFQGTWIPSDQGFKERTGQVTKEPPISSVNPRVFED